MAATEEERARRLAAALRENLKRRKAQARGSADQARGEGHRDGDRDENP
jgi:hypothetical protein